MKVFGEFEEVDGMMECRKKPIIVHAKPMDGLFRVKTMEGDYKLGKSGDYLMRGIKGELYIWSNLLTKVRLSIPTFMLTTVMRISH